MYMIHDDTKELEIHRPKACLTKKMLEVTYFWELDPAAITIA